MAKRKTSPKKERPATKWDGEKYFDATFSAEERRALQDRLMDICGYGPDPSGRGHYLAFEHNIFRPAQDEIWAPFQVAGLDYNRDHARLCDYTLIHLCRDLQVDYKSFAKNVPKLPIDAFIECAKRAFPEFQKPRNNTERRIQEHRLHMLWCDWRDEEIERTGCCGNQGNHWLCCSDRFVDPDYPAILEQIAKYNETRPKLRIAAESKAVEAPRKQKKPVLRVVANNT